MRILFLIVNLAWLFVQPTNYLFAQLQSTPLEAQAPPKQTEIGGLFGLGYNYQSGLYHSNIYLDKCKYCTFENGDKLGFSVGAVFERDLTETIHWGATLRFTTKSISASYIKYDTVSLGIKPGMYEDRAIPFDNQAEFDISLFSFQPFIKWNFLDFMFVRFGVSSAFLTSASINQTKELLKFKDTLTTGEIVNISMDGTGGNTQLIDSRAIPETNLMQFSLEPAIGFNIELGSQLYLSPLFEYSIPLTKISNQQTDFQVINWRILVELRLALKLRK